MKTIVTPFVLSSDESSRLLSCTENETSIILGDDAYHNLRISLQHAKLLLERGVYNRIYYINLPFSGKRFSENYKAAEIPEDKRLVIYNVCSGYLAETMRDIRQVISNLGDEGRAAVIINSWEMSSRSYRHRDDLVFTIYSMQMLAECTFYVYSVAESKHIIMRRSSRAGLGKLVMVADELVDLSTGKYTVAKKEEVKQSKKKAVEEEEEKIYLSDAVYLEGEEYEDFMRRHALQQERLHGKNENSNPDDDDMSASLVEDNPITVGPDGVCANVDDRKINELDIEVEEEEYRQAA